jgi:hypothetical protein
MTTRVWPISHVRSSRLFGATVLICAAVLFSSQLALAQFTQQGPKLVGTGAVDTPAAAEQGYSVSLSADGNTAIMGGPVDNSARGAAWVFTRSGSVWTQQGSKLVGADANVSTSVGGFQDNSDTGAAWMFTRSGGVWSQQGSKLVGTGAVAARQGYSVALSADGNTAVAGGPEDNTQTGAAWVYTRSGGVWAQQGSKLVGTGAAAGAEQGWSVALSADGNTAILGGPRDNTFTGAAWVFVQPTVPFSAFSAKLTRSSFKPSFTLAGDFTLGSTSDGINPITEAVTLRVGGFTTTIPPGSFTITAPGDYSFIGVIDSVTLNVLIKLKRGKEYTLHATANVNLVGAKSPATVALTIGKDTGTTTARF